VGRAGNRVCRRRKKEILFLFYTFLDTFWLLFVVVWDFEDVVFFEGPADFAVTFADGVQGAVDCVHEY
jgi:hypothetical protein